MGYRVAVVGATGAVGREMLKTLAERNFPVDGSGRRRLRPFGRHEVSFGEKTVLKVQGLDTLRFHAAGISACSARARRSRRCTRRARRRPAAS